MTNWRERGYVPASDGEDSDDELFTQEDALDPPIACTATPVSELVDAPAVDEATGSIEANHSTPQNDDSTETIEKSQSQTGKIDTDAPAEEVKGPHITLVEHDPEGPQNTIQTAQGDDAMDLDTTAPEPPQSAGPEDEFMDIDKVLGTSSQSHKTIRLSQLITDEIPVFDLSKDISEEDEESGGVSLQVGAFTNLSAFLIIRRNIKTLECANPRPLIPRRFLRHRQLLLALRRHLPQLTSPRFYRAHAHIPMSQFPQITTAACANAIQCN